jgi:trimeric autotransporter adhesin
LDTRYFFTDQFTHVRESISKNQFLRVVGKFLFITILLLNSHSIFAQCTGTITDPQGAANYLSNTNVTTTYTAPAGSKQVITFTAFITELNYDKVTIYDGPTTADPVLIVLSGNKTSSLPGPYTSTGQSLTVKFTSDTGTNFAGYSANLSCVAPCSNTTVGGTVVGDQNVCGSYNPTNITSSLVASGGTGTVQYQWESSLNNSVWSEIASATLATYDPSNITQTTYYRRKSKNNSCSTFGAISNVITKTVSTSPAAVNAGLDITQCYNGLFNVVGTPLSGGQTGLWTLVSGSATIVSPTLNKTNIVLSSGTTATLQWTVTSGICSVSDQIILSNTTSCTTSCTNTLNLNGNLEDEGLNTSFPLTFQGTPAQAIYPSSSPPGWGAGYGANVPDPATFQGAYYIKKTGVNGDPLSGTHMMYVKGSGFCYSALKSKSRVSCGKTYKISAWIAAYTNGPTQLAAPFVIEFGASGATAVPTSLNQSTSVIAPASVSWNDLNWQRYEYTFTLPSNGFEFIDFYFTPEDNNTGIVIDDVCITELSTGADAVAGPDQSGCSNAFTMNANTPPAGYTGTWTLVSGVATIVSANTPSSAVTITSGNTATLKWTVTNGTCTSNEDVILTYTTVPAITINNATVCSGSPATLTVSGCTGAIKWNTGETSTSITVSPTTTTNYSATCSAIQSNNFALNPGFESTTNFQNWNNWQNASITTNPADIKTGSKAAQLNATDWGGFAQDIAVLPGETYTIKFWAKSTNPFGYPLFQYQVLNSTYGVVAPWVATPINATNYQQYSITTVIPLNAAFIQISFAVGSNVSLYVDDVTVTKGHGCIKTATSTVTVSNATLALSNPVVSSCINQPLQDVATATTTLSWTNAPAGQLIQVKLGNETKTINPSSVTSPQTVIFNIPADGTTGKTITANWSILACAPSTSVAFSAPSPCSNDEITCKILYLCGLDKPWDGYPFDHGIISYLDLVSSNTVTPVLTENDPIGLGTYDVNSPSTPMLINLNDYKLIIVSPTTENHLSIELKEALNSFTGSVLNMNYEATDELGLTNAASYYANAISFATNSTTIEQILDYGNTNPSYNYLMTGGDYKSNATANLWLNTTSATNNSGGISYKYPAHSIEGVSSTHGPRVYFGLHMNGMYANAANGGALPVPASFDFVPTNHLTLKGKELFDQALVSASVCGNEICDNGIDDDGDGLEDCLDPDCNLIINSEFDNGTSGWSLGTQPSNSATLSVDKTKQLSGLNSAKIITTATTGTEWHVQLGQSGKSIVSGKKYKLTFRAKASASRNASVALQMTTTPFTSYFYNTIALTTTSQNFSFEFTATASVSNNISLLFNLAAVTGTVWIDQVEFKEACAAATINCGGDCVSSNLVTNGSFTTDISGWTASNGQLSLGGGSSPTGNFMVVNNPDLAGTYTVFQDIAIGANKNYLFTGLAAKHSTTPNAKVYLEFYNGVTYLSKTPDFNVTKNFDGTFQTITPVGGSTPAGTTKIRIVGWCNGTAIKLDELSLVTCNPRPVIATTTPASRCGAGAVTLGATASAGTINWYASATGGVSLGTGLSFATPSIATTTTYYVDATNGTCTTSSRTAVTATINPSNPLISGTTAGTRCGAGTVNLAATAAVGNTIKWYLAATGGSVLGTGNSFTTPSISVSTTYYVDATNPEGCTSATRTPVIATVSPTMTANINYNGSVCLTNSSTLTAVVSGGTAPFTYNWTGPAAFSSNIQTPSITVNGNYNLTITDALGCSAITTGFVYAKYLPEITTVSTTVCEGNSVVLNLNAPNATAYLWGSNAGNATTPSVTVIPSLPSSAYSVTVTNNLGCTGIANTTINVTAKPIVVITGPANICQGLTTTVTPNSGGTWSSSNPAVATITSGGVVTGVSGGTAKFTFTNSTTGCTSNESSIVTIYAKPTVSISGPNAICKLSTTQLLPSTGGTWQSSNPTVASVTNTGLVTGLSAGTATFTFTTTSGCISNATGTITIDDQIGVTITGDNTLCIGEIANLNASVGGGTWSTSNSSVVSINATGQITAIGQGSATITYNHNSGSCSNESTYSIIVSSKPSVVVSGSDIICSQNTTQLSPSTGGTWSSSNNAIATVSNSGLVTGLSAGVVSFIFTSDAGCSSNPTQNITINTKPNAIVTGPATVCLGNTTQLTPTTGGTWASSNNSVATINSSGFVNSVLPGTATFIFTSTSGCISNPSAPVTVVSKPTIAIDYNGSICLTGDSKLSVNVSGGTAPFNYAWTGPAAFTGNTQLINITNNGNYAVTVTDANLCSVNTTGFVYEKFDPLVLNLQTKVCQGAQVTLNATTSSATSYLWSPNAANSTSPTVTVTPSVPSTAYFVTVTNSLGCTAVANATIAVDPKPIVEVTGGGTICIGATTTLTPASGGTWSSNNPAVATISNTGVVTAISQGTSTFIFTNSTTTCASNESAVVTVSNSPVIGINGPSNVCINGTTNLVPSSGGVWTSSNPAIATINNQGLVTGVTSGTVTFSFVSNASNCAAATSVPISVSPKPTVDVTGDDILCIGNTSNLFPTSGGTWASSNPSVAMVSSTGVVNAVAPGSATFIFTNNSGCASNPTTPITVNPKPTVNFTGPTSVCVGGTSSISPTNGLWTSSNESIATISNTGLINSIAPGTVTFTFTSPSNSCISDPSAPFTVNPKPTVLFTGPNSLCIGNNSSLSPTTGGTWTSNNPLIATVSNNGIITAIAEGTTTFYFTNTSNNCISSNTVPLSVYSKPPTSILGANSICIGESTTMSPSSGGTWTSSNSSVATINNSGVVVGISTGVATFTYFEANSGCSSNPSAPITVGSNPIATVTGPTSICVNAITTLSPTSGGTWISNNSAIASVSNSGVVTGLSQGSSTFTFVSNSGCTSNPTLPITINGKPSVVFTGPTSICVGGTSSIIPSTGGTWISNNPSIAIINNSGIITGIAPGVATFTYTSQSTGCVSEASALLTVNTSPILTYLGSNSICIGSTTQLAPTSGGVWTSSNNDVATVNSNGLVFGITPGTAFFSFVNSNTGCNSASPIPVTINSRPTVGITGSSSICIGSTTTLSPNTGGTWESQYPTIASVTNTGIVTGLQQGLARFTFTSDVTNCTSLNTLPVVINGRPTTSFSGPSDICVGGNTQLSPSVGGTWTSSNPLVATVTNSGAVTGVAIGNASFVFTETASGCSSLAGQNIATVSSPTPPSIIGDATICLGYQTQLSPSFGVIWSSSNPKIASVSNDGVVTGKAPGKVTFTYTSIETGCSASLPADAVLVKSCIDPDFNVTLVNIPLKGNVSTNDEVPAGTSWGPPMLVSKPSGSISSLTMNPDGTYNFVANTKGKYVFNVPVCIPPLTFGCPSTQIYITVADPLNSNNKNVSNIDLASVYTGNNIWMNALSNDKCLFNVSCSVNGNSMTKMNTTLKGTAVNGVIGGFVYTPYSNEIGLDTIVYNVCVDGESTNCTESKQFITINSLSAANSTVASDDFLSTYSSTTVVQNLLSNDNDPENDLQTITAQGTSASKIIIPEGSYFITSSGELNFTPKDNFIGPVDIVYTVCDNNLTAPVCVKATAHILVFGDMNLQVRVYLEGALMTNGNLTTPEGRPLMRDDIRVNPFDGKNYIPARDPYKFGTKFVKINNKYTKHLPGSLPQYDFIADSTNVFAVTGTDAIVDWVFVELRSPNDNKVVVASRSGLLQRDGDVVDLDGISSLKFSQTLLDSFYVVVRHRNHFGVMSQKVKSGTLVDFTSPSTPVWDFGTTHPNGLNYTGLAQNVKVKTGYRAMWAGDFDQNKRIKFTNPSDDQNFLYFDVLSNVDNTSLKANFNFALGYYQGDFNMNGKSKYDNPSDDKNLLFSQIILYPLNTNYSSIFNFMIEQIP